MEQYDHNEIEGRLTEAWKLIGSSVTNISAPDKPFYNLMMFPYPSAEGLHVGNMYAFTGSDIYGRFKRMQGHEVFEPIGLDGFGIHSENYALKIGRHPVEHAQITQKNYYNQLQSIGAMYDWTRTVETYDPNYYKWTQWLFVTMFKHGLAYRSKALVNWCLQCKTVLADEQVIDGKCERCGNNVEKRPLEQWFFSITAYAEKLLNNLKGLDWSEKVKVAQENWIGKKEGIIITYPVVDTRGKSIGAIDCFTTRPDTNFGATFVVLAPEHPFINQLDRVIGKEQLAAISKYKELTRKKSDQDRVAEGRKKTGVFTGLFCINQLTGKKIPLYISDFVLMGFGTGAVVGVPGHDKRDFEFAREFKIPIVRVVVGVDGDTSSITKHSQVQEESGTMVNSDFLNGLEIKDAIEAMMIHLEKKGWGIRQTSYHLRDWLLSRQRYWGPPIPMIYCKHCAAEGKSWFDTEEAKQITIDKWFKFRKGSIQKDGAENGNSGSWNPAGWYPESEKELPVLLPTIDDYKPGDDGVAPLAKHKEFYETKCPGCGNAAVRETDVSDTFLDSSWYFLRYPTVGSNNSSHVPFDQAITKTWLPVDMYTGGAEHSVLHLMYSRFVTMALHDFGYLDFEEPFARFFAHGLVIKDGAKMSKSKGNVVNPDEYIKTYGADALRMYLMFMGPFSQGGDFRDSAMEGMSRWVKRIWRMAGESIKGNKLRRSSLDKSLNRLIKKVTEDIERRHYNTAIAAMMEYTNEVMESGEILSVEDLSTFLLLLAPFAPFITDELWQHIHKRKNITIAKDSIHSHRWPTFSKEALIDENVEIVVQVNGKLRDKFSLNASEAKQQDKVVKRAIESEHVRKFLNGQDPRKVIFVPGKLLNLVI